jgi:hypothetical protein
MRSLDIFPYAYGRITRRARLWSRRDARGSQKRPQPVIRRAKVRLYRMGVQRARCMHDFIFLSNTMHKYLAGFLVQNRFEHARENADLIVLLSQQFLFLVIICFKTMYRYRYFIYKAGRKPVSRRRNLTLSPLSSSLIATCKIYQH